MRERFLGVDKMRENREIWVFGIKKIERDGCLGVEKIVMFS